MRDPEQPDRLNPEFLFENDWLHPNAKGYQEMGESIDLKLFEK
jgi:lysophospholipase L1-like esterase